MIDYYVNKNEQSNGKHEVHTAACSNLPDSENRLYLGNFSSCHQAIRAAKKFYKIIDGCSICSEKCHTL